MDGGILVASSDGLHVRRVWFFEEHRRQTYDIGGGSRVSIAVLPSPDEFLAPISFGPYSTLAQRREGQRRFMCALTRERTEWRVVVVSGDLQGTVFNNRNVKRDSVFPTREQANRYALELAVRLLRGAGFVVPDPIRSPLRPGLSSTAWFAGVLIGLVLVGLALTLFGGQWVSTNQNVVVAVYGLLSVPIGVAVLAAGRLLWLRRQRRRARGRYPDLWPGD